MDRDKVTYVQITRLVKPKIKKEGTITSNSRHTNRGSEILFLALMHTHPRSSLSSALHSTKEAALL